MHSYTYLNPERVLSGAGCISELPAELKRLGCERAFVLSTRSLDERTNAVRKLESLLGGAWAATYGRCRQHSPRATVGEAAEAARACRADALVVLGGGSVTDTAKALAIELGREGGDLLPQLDVPTTLSAGEFTPAAGITNEETRTKELAFDLRAMPRVVFFDPEACVHTPADLWLSTGVKALDHACEALWCNNPHPYVDGIAVEAIRRLVRWLPDSADSTNLEARGECQIGAWMSISGILNAGVRLSHPLGHQIGAYWGVPHGVTSCVTLPSVMRLLASRTEAQQLKIAEGLGVEGSGRAASEVIADAADTLERFIASLGVPTRLRDTAARRDEIPAVAKAVAFELAHMGRLEDLENGEASVVELLDSLW